MRPEIIGELVNGAIPVFGGIYATLIGFRVVGKRRGANLKYDDWHNRFGGLLKVVGPLLVLFGLFLSISGIARVSSSSRPSLVVDWRRHTTSDGVCGAEFPQPPKQDTKFAMGVESDRLTLLLPGRDIYYMLTFSDIPANAPSATDEERLDLIRNAMPSFTAQLGMNFEFVHEEKISENGVHGRKLEFAAGKKHTFQMKVFILGTRAYRIIAVTPQSIKDDEETRRFLNSFRFENNKK